MGLLALGAVQLFRDRSRPALRWTLALSVLYQLLLHLLYGRELFLYAIHFVPLLVIVASYATTSRWRTAVLALSVVFSLANAANNLSVYSWAKDYTRRHAPLKKLEGIT